MPLVTPQSDILVTPTWLADQLNNPDLRVIDCRLTRIPQPAGPSLWVSEYSAWKNEHIAGASYLHLIDDLCDQESKLPFMLASPKDVSAALGRFGISEDSIIVLYGLSGEWITHRAWWSLKASGVADVRLLDGGFNRWLNEDMPIESGVPTIKAGTIRCESDKRFIATKSDVKESMTDPSVVAINALSPELFRGEGEQMFGKPGHIPGSINIPADDLIDPESGDFHPVEDLQAIFDGHGLGGAKKIIPYCGGGIAASTLFFALSLAGYEDVSLYDGSLFDWTSDPELPMELGD